MKHRRLTALLLMLLLCAALGASSFALVPHRGYSYDNNGIATAAPIPYSFEQEVNGVDYGIGAFTSAADLFVDQDDNIYVLDGKNARVCIFDSDLELVRIIGSAGEGVVGSEISYQGENVTFNAPSGLFVYEHFDKKLLYVADTGNARIVRFDMLGELDKKGSVEEACQPIAAETIYTKPAIDLINENAAYKPLKLVVDRAERMHVVCQTINRGIVKLNPDGSFNSFYGAPEVSYELIEKFWRLISTNEQLARMEHFVPTEYNNIAMDPEGFVWVVTKTIADRYIHDSMKTDYDDTAGRQEHAPVKKINSYGTDITSRTGTYPPVGDIASVTIEYERAGSGVNVLAQMQVLCGTSAFEDITVDEYGCYYIMDSLRHKVFCYDCDGNLLFQFANDGTQFGTFKNPVAIGTFQDDKVIVLDSIDASLMIFKPTDYGARILAAVRAYQQGEYQQSEDLWQEVLKMNSNNMLAYSGVGKALYRSGEYRAAMRYFTIAKNVEYYSKALEEYLHELIGNKFTVVFLVIVGIVLVIWIIKTTKQFRSFLRNGVKKVM